MMSEIVKTEEKYKFKALQFQFDSLVTTYGFWKTLWGMDIFVGEFPIIKAGILANIIVWLALFGG